MFWRVHAFGTKGWAEARGETTLVVALNGKEPDVREFPQVNSLAVLLEAFAESVELRKPFPVSTAEMLDIVGAFEAIIRSVDANNPVSVRRD